MYSASLQSRSVGLVVCLFVCLCTV